MAPLLAGFLAALLAEFGDKTQLLAAALAVAYRRPAPILAGLVLAAVAGSLIAAGAGVFVHGRIALRATVLLVALSLLVAGGSALLKPRTPTPFVPGKTPAFLAAFLCLLAAQMGGTSQFIAFALAAHYGSFGLAGAGVALGITAAGVPAVLLAGSFAKAVPLRAIRLSAAGLFLIAGFALAVNALRLV